MYDDMRTYMKMWHADRTYSDDHTTASKFTSWINSNMSQTPAAAPWSVARRTLSIEQRNSFTWKLQSWYGAFLLVAEKNNEYEILTDKIQFGNNLTGGKNVWSIFRILMIYFFMFWRQCLKSIFTFSPNVMP